MKKLISIILIVLICLSAVSCGASEPETTSAIEEETTAYINTSDKNIKKVMKEFTDIGVDGVCAVSKDGKVIAMYSSGVLHNDVPITKDTPMPIGSISKQFCAAAIMKLCEEKKLSLSDKVTKYFPDYKNAKDVTIHNMLSMRSGIPNFNDTVLKEVVSLKKTDEQNTKSLFSWLFKRKLHFKPDSMYEYSNCAYILLGNIIEKITGKKYIDYLREVFFTPLKMNHTGSIFELKDKPKWAKNFSYTEKEMAGGIEQGLAKGAGDIISTAGDMIIWMNSLKDGKVVSKDSLKKMTTPYTDESDAYGYGLMLNMSDGYGHQGSISHFNSCDYINPNTNVTIFMSSNVLSATTVFEQVIKLIDNI